MEAQARLSQALTDRYRIEREIGAGGMATVYLAQDLKHDRKVALKVLKPELAAVVGSERFLAEIKTTANLQHPHILPLFDSGEADGFLFFVMPFVEGESLRDRLDREGELPVEEAVRIATAVASALDYAHRHGVIHRDIKPANILLHDGQPLVADFGIALAVSAAGGGRLTETGLSLGTPFYMSPEQATAERDPDPRSDVYALGCVLYEMLVGEPPYTGSSAQAVLGKILTTDPVRPTEHRKTIPAHVEAAVLKALEKRPADRFGSPSELAGALENPNWGGALRDTSRARERRVVIPATALVIGTLIGVLSTWALLLGDGADTVGPAFIPLSPPPGVELGYDFGQSLVAVSPDGRQIVYAAMSDGVRRLYLHDLATPQTAEPVPGTEGGASPFFSPDGKTLGFFAGFSLKVVSLAGGEARTLWPTPVFGGAVFSSDGETIYFNPEVDDGIWKVPVAGGEATPVTTPLRDGFDNSHRYPDVLPGGKLLYTSAFGRFRLVVYDLATGESTPILGSEIAFYGRYVASGHVLFANPGGVMAAEFDPETLETGAPFEVLPDAVVEQESQANFAVSKNGTLVYLRGISAFERTLARYGRDGSRRTLETGGPQPFSLRMNASPEGGRIALALSRGGQQDVFLYDLAREDLRQLLTEPHNDFNPEWSRDGTRVVFSTARRGILDLYSAPADRESLGEPLVVTESSKWPGSWSPGDTLLVFESSDPETRVDLWLYSVTADSAWVYRAGSESEGWPQFSPDGRWLAFQKGEESTDVYVTPFPGPGPECKVSRGGGAEPRWSGDGNELLYRVERTAMVADVSDRDFCGAESRPLFDGLEALMWTVAPDGSFFVTVEPRGTPELWLVQNWFEVLRAGGGAR
jgi:serine/threonine protein kinase